MNKQSARTKQLIQDTSLTSDQQPRTGSSILMMSKRGTLAEMIKELDMVRDTSTVAKDEVDFHWMSNEELIDFALDYERVKILSNDSKESLIYILGRRFDNFINED